MYKKINDYGLIGDMHSLALVSKDGSLDYASMPHMDSPTVFAALLDDEKGGYFSIRPAGIFSSRQEYIKDTNILSSVFSSEEGHAQLLDFMPLAAKGPLEEISHSLHRCLKVTEGKMSFRMELVVRPDYARATPEIEKKKERFIFRYKKDVFTLVVVCPSYEIRESPSFDLVIDFSLSQGEEAHFSFIYGEAAEKEAGVCRFEETAKTWRGWLHGCVGERCYFFGDYTAMINRSLLALKLLTFEPTGAIAAAATTSLPESIGGSRNWDYRFTWIRDASFTLKAMFHLGHIREADSFIRWLHGVYRSVKSRNLQIMYSLAGKPRLTEISLGHLKGYRDSRPVRVGNNAYGQKQWDIYGEVMDVALRLSDYTGKIDEELWPFFVDICNLACENWRKPDEGIWEVREGPSHFVYSKVMCWVALDRGLKIAKRYGFEAPLQRWEKEAQEIRKEVLEKGYNKGARSFVGRYGSVDLDASLLLLPLMGFLPIGDERIQSTIQACRNHLMEEGFLLRYRSPDGLSGSEGTFLLCNFWLIECLVLSQKTQEAKDLLALTTKAANHLGLFSEEYDVRKNEMLGNFPQAFSHIGYINAASAILGVQIREFRQQARPASLVNRMRKLLPFKITLNEPSGEEGLASKELAAELKLSLNRLQGAFFDSINGRVDYQAMKASSDFSQYLELVRGLNRFDPSVLKGDDEKKAFWINIYNILIIHGVIELEIRESVLEVFNFFSRIGYVIGGHTFSADDVEHGILRGNARHPVIRLKPFSLLDSRRSLAVKQADPRIHCALVCASNSCPPIEFYDSRRIGEQLDLACRSFIRRKGAFLRQEEGVLHLSAIFKWYYADFGGSRQRQLDFIHRYASPELRRQIEENRRRLRIAYLPYDWNLNRTLER